jgi:hypothetical protein
VGGHLSPPNRHRADGNTRLHEAAAVVADDTAVEAAGTAAGADDIEAAVAGIAAAAADTAAADNSAADSCCSNSPARTRAGCSSDRASNC